MKHALLKKHRLKTSVQRRFRRKNLSKKIRDIFDKEYLWYQTATSIKPSTKCEPIEPAVYSTQSVYLTKLGVVVVWYSEKLKYMNFLMSYQQDRVITSITYSHWHKFKIEDVAVRFTEIVKDVYENTK